MKIIKKRMLNKKIESEIAVGIIVLIASAVGGIFWLQNKKDIKESDQQKTEQEIQKPIEKTAEVSNAAPVINSDLEVSLTTRNNKNYVILRKDGIEKIIDQGDVAYDKNHSNLNEVKQFSDAKLSSGKNYLTYNMKGWEWSIDYLYDIKNDKVALKQSAASTFEFTPDEKYFINCAASEFDGTFDGKIFSSSDFGKPIFDAVAYTKIPVNSYGSITCNVDGDKVSFRFNNDNIETVEKLPKDKTVVYSLSEQKVIN